MNRLGWLGQHQRYTSHSATGIIRMGARLYDPNLGRFLGVDPIRGGSANDYDYVIGDPVNNLDLDGMFCLTGRNRNGSCRSLARGVKRVAGQATPAGWLARGTYVITATTVTGAVCAVSVGIGCVIGGLSFGSLSGVVWEATAKREKKNYPCSALKGAVAGGIGKTAEGLTGFVGGQAAKQLVPCG